MKSGWTVALVIAASLSAQTAVAAESKPADLQFASLLKLLTATSLVAPDTRFADALGLTTVSCGLDFNTCTGLAARDELNCCSPGCLTAGAEAVHPPAMLLFKFDVEVRGP